jgi:hypothetical protein
MKLVFEGELTELMIKNHLVRHYEPNKTIILKAGLNRAYQPLSKL